jgi:glyoxylase-like metal-dependent hydrolase (beta-lactamase superfamily II)
MLALDARTGPEVIAEGCVRVSLPDPFVPGVTSVFVIGSGRDRWLLDSGADTPESEESLRAKLTELGLAPEDTPMILSHTHLDHAGGLLRFAPRELVAHERAVAEMRETKPRSSRGPEALRRMGLAEDAIAALAPDGEPVHGAPFVDTTVHVVLEGSSGSIEGPDGWRWVLAEGHAPGHLMLFDEQTRTLLAGDQFLRKWKTPLIVSDPEFDSLGAYLDSVRRARELSPARVCSSHMATMDDPTVWFDETLGAFEKRLVRVSVALDDGAGSAEEILTRVYPNTATGPLRIVFLREFLAILRHLEASGSAFGTVEGGVEIFRPV